jgi:hypothetical protein
MEEIVFSEPGTEFVRRNLVFETFNRTALQPNKVLIKFTLDIVKGTPLMAFEICHVFNF